MTSDEEKRLRILAASTVTGSDLRSVLADVDRLRAENRRLERLAADERLRRRNANFEHT